MTFDEYQTQAITTLAPNHAYGDLSAELLAQILGLVGESGEVADKCKKLIRDKQGKLSPEDKQEIFKELGDVLWYINAIAHLMGGNISDIAANNLEKVLSRKERGTISGSGDNR